MKWGIRTMKSIKSYFDKGIILNECKRLYWVPIMYFLGLFISIPLQILLEVQRYAPDLEENLQFLRITRNVLGFRHPGTILMLYVVPVAVGLLLYRYMQDRKNSDMIHSLPIKRETLFLSHGITGVLFLSVPLLLTVAITALIHQIFSLDFIFTLQDLWIWAGTIMLMSLVLYASTIFVGMVTGMTIAQGILTYIVLFLPVGLYQLVIFNMEYYLYGFSWERYGGLSTELIQQLSPLVRIGMLTGEPVSAMEVIGYSLFVVLIMALGAVLYKRRRLENNLQVIVFKPLKHLFKYGVTFSVMLLAGTYFYSASNGSMGWVWFGYLFFALLGYGLAEAIIQKTVRILSWKMVRGFMIYGGVILLTIGILALDVTGFEQRQPAAEEIEGVYIGYNDYDYRRMKEYGSEDLVFHEEENIRRAMELHQTLVDVKDEIQHPQERMDDARPFYLVYQLKNGERLTRYYPGVPREIYIEAYGKLVESEEYKYSRYPILSVPQGDLQRVSIQGYTKDAQVTILEPEGISGFLEALQKDINEAAHDDLYNHEMWGSMTFLLEEGKEIPSPYGPDRMQEIYVPWSKAFNETEQWLKNENLLEEVRLTGNQVAYMVVEPYDGSEQAFYEGDFPEEIVEEDSEDTAAVKRYETRNAEEIEAALQLSDSGWRGGGGHSYKVGFYDEDGSQILLESFRKDRVPTFVMEFYNEAVN